MNALVRCMGCGKWTNYGINCITCSPKPLDKTPKEEEPDEYYEEYLPPAPNYGEEEVHDE